MSDMTADTAVELPRARTDWLPLLLVPALALLALPFVGSPSTWVTLTVAGLAMGMMIFLMASGLTLVFGLMDIINFGHGVFISLGAYATLLVLGPLAGWATADSVGLNLALLLLCILVAMAVTGVVGAVFERVIVRPVYGSHLKQILVTMGGLIVAEQLIHAIWGASPIPIPLPQSLRGAFVFGDIVMERYRVVAVAIGLLVFIAMQLLLNRTRLGLLIRAGVENPEMVEALGYRIRRLFVSVFVAGSALAGLGGVMWAFYRQTLTAGMGMEVMVLVFIVIIIGGLGSVGGCFVGSILVALVANYVGFIEPKLALISNILVMALVLIWRPQGLFPVARR
ncbi:branched-chain amino acid ABC transporter permease [Microvirga terrae]|uniref:Branched-chain amino acid ABC transporter permease n=1 Tax=Microvirga terrae TaxID=2740529 RepID=A0ABY5RV33_9HYPH|nr:MULTISPECIES: branched-chain amino acid ABC transporter permease [Microvirga]MBQ0823934.1 branched-chain amino acid ABC transporter permease [Microvirga sp. HBU67558]UVF21115.1 branched-chain amino acid ABC transporter permease [Microvirga terrae]